MAPCSHYKSPTAFREYRQECEQCVRVQIMELEHQIQILRRKLMDLQIQLGQRGDYE